MKQGDFWRIPGLVSIASAGAGLALVGASLSGHFGSTTTIEEFVPSATSTSARAESASSGALTIQQIYERDAPGVVAISASVSSRSSGGMTTMTIRPLGSGFVIDKAGHIVTGSNVVGAERRVEVSFSGSEEVNARVVGVDPSTGIAVLQVDIHSRGLIPLALGDSDAVEVGDPVVAIGNPVSHTRVATAGIVSGLQRTVEPAANDPRVAQTIETDAAINHSNAGGPLINARGQVIGVNRAFGASAASAGGTLGLGLAIPIDSVKEVVAQLIRDGRVDHAYLGINAVALTPTLARAFDLPSTSGLLVEGVAAGSAAHWAGLRAGRTTVVLAGESYLVGGDIIVTANGEPVRNQAQLRDVLETLRPGQRLRLELWRGGKEETIAITLGRPPS